ncbi:hypothetical protein EBR57_10310 [bacterium]|nr:hypothetical protein [bacterium]
MTSLPSGGMGWGSSVSFAPIDIGMRRQGLPNVVVMPMTAAERRTVGDEFRDTTIENLRSVGSMVQKVPDPVYDVASVALGVAEVTAYATGVGVVPIAAANLALNAGALTKTYRNEGASRNFKVQLALASAGPVAGKFGKGIGLAVGAFSTRAGLLYGGIK